MTDPDTPTPPLERWVITYGWPGQPPGEFVETPLGAAFLLAWHIRAWERGAVMWDDDEPRTDRPPVLYRRAAP